jgi:hypothetical protein
MNTNFTIVLADESEMVLCAFCLSELRDTLTEDVDFNVKYNGTDSPCSCKCGCKN